MGKNRNDGSNGKLSDGRRSNVPPEHSRIQPGEVRNPWGRGGKPAAESPTPIDELFWQEASRIVSRDENGPVDVKKRLVQEEISAALRDKTGSVRARLLAQLQDSGARVDSQHQKILAFFIEAKFHVTEQFHLAETLGRPAPNILPHPDHVEIRGDEVHFFGPTDRRGRAAWEVLKSTLSVTACIHKIYRDELRRTNSAVVLKQLKEIEQHRRWLMRRVPKGWNWREEIYCRDSRLKLTNDLIRDIEEIGYVEPEALD